MKTNAALLAIFALLASTSAIGGEHRNGSYVTKKGTYVAPHYQTNANHTKLDNYSTKGNYNPHTGKAGTVDPYKPRKSRSH